MRLTRWSALLAPLSSVVLVLVLVLVAAPSAVAATPPTCDEDVWSRPGLERTLEIYCQRTDRVRVAEMPTHGAVTGDRFDGWHFRFRLSTRSDAPTSDRVVLDLDGPAGSARHAVRIHNVPLHQNSAPRCYPVSTALRTDGSGPATVHLNLDCWDPDHDDFTLHGAGPGTHLDAPATVAAGGSSISGAYWRYLTAVRSGPEQTAYWAVDSQGARSPDTPVSVEVGPLVDRLPTCRSNAGNPILMRPGVTRRFGIYCEDPDGDTFEPRVATPPLNGALTSFDVGEPQPGWWGEERFVDVTYDPFAAFEGDDRFGVVAAGARGVGPVSLVSLDARPFPHNSGGGCGWSGGSTAPGQEVTLEARCGDGDGDPLLASLVDLPAHGIAHEPVVGPSTMGDETIRIRYEPNPGFEGIDYLTVRVGDGNGSSHELEFSIEVATPMPPEPPMEYTPGADPDGWFWSPAGWARAHRPAQPPAVGQALPVAPAGQARRALRTSSVRLVRRLGHALVFAPRKPLTAAARVRAFAVTCAVRCEVESARLLAGANVARRGRARVAPGRAGVLTLRLSAAQRQRVRRSGSGRAILRVTARPVTGAERSGRVRVRLRR